MEDPLEPLALIWDDLLSGEPEKIKNAFAQLEKVDQKIVLEHLRDMAEGEGWQPGQQESAEAALTALLE